MQRQSNRYEILPNGKYILHIGGKTPIKCVFNEDVYNNVKAFNWSHRGKGIIKNNFDETLGAVVAYTYGYDAFDWTRKVSNDDYTASNFCTRNEQASHTPTLEPEELAQRIRAGKEEACKKQFDPKGVPFMARVRYRTKYECIKVTIPRFDQLSDVTVLVNKFLIQYIPVTVGLRNGIVVCKDGTPLKVLLLEKLGIDTNVRRYWSHVNVQDEFDLRVDPNDLSYVSRKMDRVRAHFVEDEDAEERYVVIEVQENLYNNKFPWLADINAKWRIPYGVTCKEARVSYVAVDEDVYERIDEVFWDDRQQEWMVRDCENKDLTDAGFIKPTQLKRLVASMAGLHIDNVYIAPEINPKYKLAMDTTADLSTPEGRKAARRRAMYENHSSIDEGQAMYKPAKLIKRRQVVADKQLFCPYIYGGVGVWCYDMRKCSVRLRGIKAPEQDNADTSMSTPQTKE